MCFDVCFDVCCKVTFNVCFEGLTMEMEPSLSVYVSICLLFCACVYAPCSLPAFNGVLSYKSNGVF